MKKALIAMLLCATTVLSANALMVSACPASGPCTGYTIHKDLGEGTTNGTHQVGGFLGFGTTTCYITDYYRICEDKCSTGHNLGRHYEFLWPKHTQQH